MVREGIEMAFGARRIHLFEEITRVNVAIRATRLTHSHATRQHVDIGCRVMRGFVGELEQVGVVRGVRFEVAWAVVPEAGVARFVPDFVILDALRRITLDHSGHEFGVVSIVFGFGRKVADPESPLVQRLFFSGTELVGTTRPFRCAADLHQHFHAVFLREFDSSVEVFPVVIAVFRRLRTVPRSNNAHPFDAQFCRARVAFFGGGKICAPSGVERLYADAVCAAEAFPSGRDIDGLAHIVETWLLFRVVGVMQGAARAVVTGQRQCALVVIQHGLRLLRKVAQSGEVKGAVADGHGFTVGEIADVHGARDRAVGFLDGEVAGILRDDGLHLAER